MPRFSVFLFGALLAATPSQRVFAQELPLADSVMAQIEAEQTMVFAATELAKDGDFQAALDLIREPLPNSTRLPAVDEVGFRAASIAGFLRNQGKYREADTFSRLALKLSWVEPGAAATRGGRARSQYWRALLAAEIDEHDHALLWLEAARDAEGEEPRLRELRERVQRLRDARSGS